mgnify:CR=1 FL=1|jgi:hypothetical protein
MWLVAEAGMTDLTSLGAAGLMGAMWLWERQTSRRRDQQLDEAHQRILGDRVQLEQLISVLRENAEALGRLCTTQEVLLRQIGGAKAE